MSHALRSVRFRDEHQTQWKRLEELVSKVERGGARRLSADEAIELPMLYRKALSSLSVARETLLERATLDYLEALVTRAYLVVYANHEPPFRAVQAFFARGWSVAVRTLALDLVIATLLLVVGGAAAWLLVASDPDWFFSLVSREMAGDRGPAVSAERLEDMLYEEHEASGLSFFAASLFSNNTGVAFLAFALGFAFGVPTAVLLVYNGAVLGAMLQVYFAKGLGVGFVGWLAIHGVTELLAIALAGAAGLRLGRAAAFPGALTRLESLRKAGQVTAPAMAGVVIMLTLAALIEGYGRQLIANDVGRYAIAGVTAVFWLTYFAFFGKRTELGQG